jgi:hypothetical protein
MFNICPRCGMYSEQKTIDPSGPFAICRHCGHAHPFKQLPLFIVTGASGSGKSAACLQLVPLLPECVVLETDLFWRPEFATPEKDYRDFRNLCLRVAKNIGLPGAYLLRRDALPRAGVRRRRHPAAFEGSSAVAGQLQPGTDRGARHLQPLDQSECRQDHAAHDAARYVQRHDPDDCRADRGVGAAASHPNVGSCEW